MPDFIATSPKKLDKSVDGWGSAIKSELTSWGMPPGSIINVGFGGGRDEARGSAAGTVTVTVNKIPVNIPVVIKDFKLYPMDVMEVGGKYSPLTKGRLKSIYASGSPFGGPVNMQKQVSGDGEDIASLITPPSYQTGMRKFMSSVDRTIVSQLVVNHDNPEIKDFYRSINPDIARLYKKNGNHDVLMSVMKKEDGELKIVEHDGGAPKLRDPNEVSVMWVPPPDEESVRNGFVTVLAASGRRFDPALMRLPLNQMKALYSNHSGIDPAGGGDVYVDLKDGEFKRLRSVDYGEHAIENILGVSEKSIDDYRLKAHKVFTGARELEVVRPRDVYAAVHDCNTGEKTPGMVTANGKLLLGESFFGTAKNVEDLSGMCSPCDPMSKKSVLFHDPADCDSIAFGPLKVKHTESCPIPTPDGPISSDVYVCEAGGSPVRVVLSDAFKDIAFGDGTVFAPAKYRTRDISGAHNAVHPSQANFIAKAAADAHGDWMRLYSADRGTTITIDMPERVKVAYERVFEKEVQMDFDGLPPKFAEFVVTAAGVHPDDAKNLVKEAQSSSITAYGIEYLEPVKIASQQKEAEYKIKLAELKREFSNRIRVNLVKEAANIQDKSSVDAVLGLGLADEHNVDAYIDNIPKYQEIVEELAQMLPAARSVGGPVTEEAIRKAMIAVENFLEEAETYLAAKQQLDSMR